MQRAEAATSDTRSPEADANPGQIKADDRTSDPPPKAAVEKLQDGGSGLVGALGPTERRTQVDTGAQGEEKHYQQGRHLVPTERTEDIPQPSRNYSTAEGATNGPAARWAPTNKTALRHSCAPLRKCAAADAKTREEGDGSLLVRRMAPSSATPLLGSATRAATGGCRRRNAGADNAVRRWCAVPAADSRTRRANGGGTMRERCTCRGYAAADACLPQPQSASPTLGRRSCEGSRTLRPRFVTFVCA